MTDGQIITDLYEAFGKGDIPTVLAAMDTGMVWDEAEGFMYGGRYHGPYGVAEGVFSRFGKEWEGFTVTPYKIIDDGAGDVVAFGTYTGTYLPTGKSMSVHFCHSWTLRDGKAIGFVQYVDTLVIAKQLGLIQ